MLLLSSLRNEEVPVINVQFNPAMSPEKETSYSIFLQAFTAYYQVLPAKPKKANRLAMFEAAADVDAIEDGVQTHLVDYLHVNWLPLYHGDPATWQAFLAGHRECPEYQDLLGLSPFDVAA